MRIMEVERLTEADEFQKVGNAWNELLISSRQNNIFLTHQWFSSWWEWFSQGKSLEVLLLKNRKGRLIGAAPLMRDGERLRFLASEKVSDYCDFVIRKGKEKEFFIHFLDLISLRYPRVRTIELNNIKQSSPTLVLLPEIAASHQFSCASWEKEVTLVASLPPSYEDFLSLLSRKSRHELRRKLRRMEELEGVKFVKVTHPKEMQAATKIFIDLHRRSGPSKESFWKSPHMEDFFLEVVLQFSKKGWVELLFLRHKEEIMASLLSFLYEDSISFYNVAFNREYARYSPGLYLFHECLKQAILERRKTVDFLRGREKYKYYFGAKEDKIFNLTLTPGVLKE
ncbi:MAG: GNAT family N-acetyltransferase [Candidatus Aminicenantales bacterium]